MGSVSTAVLGQANGITFNGTSTSYTLTNSLVATTQDTWIMLYTKSLNQSFGGIVDNTFNSPFFDDGANNSWYYFINGLTTYWSTSAISPNTSGQYQFAIAVDGSTTSCSIYDNRTVWATTLTGSVTHTSTYIQMGVCVISGTKYFNNGTLIEAIYLQNHLATTSELNLFFTYYVHQKYPSLGF
jgi:hypothetical protein